MDTSEPGWAYKEMLAECSDAELQEIARLQVVLKSEQFIRIRHAKAEMEKRGLTYPKAST